MRIAPELTTVVTLAALGVALGGWSGCRDSSASSAEGTSSATATVPEVKDTVLPGVDTSPMTPRERHAWSSLVTTLYAPCPSVPVPVAQCVLEKRACGTCLQAAKWVARAIREGGSEDQIQHAYKERFDPSTIKTLPLDGSPTKGPDTAPVTIVEFADFECPHCREAVALIDEVMAAHPDKVRLVYKNYTLPFHTHGEAAARAAFAAGIQGKFWEMEHLLFERQQHLEDSDIDRYGTMLKLDLPKWKLDMASPAVKTQVADDHKLGEDLKLKGTPTIYVNGRELDVEADELLEDRVNAELGLATGAAASAVPPVPPVPSASSASSASPTASAPAPAPSASSKPR